MSGRTIQTRGHEYNSASVLGGVRITVQNKMRTPCDYTPDSTGDTYYGMLCRKLEANKSQAPMVLKNGVQIEYDVINEGYSVFFSDSLPRCFVIMIVCIIIIVVTITTATNVKCS